MINATDAADDVFVLAADLDVDEDLTISAGALDANGTVSRTVRVAGDWANTVGRPVSCPFGKVDFDGDPASRSISGSSTFYDLEISSGTAQSIAFESGETQTVTHDLVLTGSAGNLLTLAPSVAATDWYLAAPASQTVQYVSATYSDASGGRVIAANDGTNQDGPPTET